MSTPEQPAGARRSGSPAAADFAFALEAAEERFGALFLHASDPILILSLQGEILSVNEAFEALTGIRSQELFHSEKNWKDFTFPEDLDALRDAIETCREGRRVTTCETRLLRPDREALWFEHRITVLHDEERDPKGFLLVARNIHVRKQHEVELRQAAVDMQQRNLRSRQLIDRLKEFFTRTADLPSDIDAFLDGMCRILSEMYHPTLVAIQIVDGRCFSREAGVRPPQCTRGLPSAICRKVLESGAPLVLNHLGQDEEFADDPLVRDWAFETYVGAALRDASGEIRGTLALFDRDEPHREHADIELVMVAALQVAARLRSEEQEQAHRDLEGHLFQSQKMESLGLLAGGIAHDFNNILSGILGFSSHLVGKVEPDTPLHHDLKLIETSAERAAMLTRQLLAFARRKHFPKEPVSLNQVIDETLLILRRTLAKTIRIKTELDPDLPRILGDAGQLSQVMMNLCVNASDAMAEGGGVLSIHSRREIPAAHREKLDLKVGGARRDFVAVRVADTGTGIPPEDLGHIFEPFFTTKKDTGGSGLGLSIVYGIVTNHGGDIIAESNPGQGTAFSLYLPAHSEEGVIRPAPLPADLHGTETILVVDDELIVRQMVTEILRDHGYTVITASSGNHAMDLLPRLEGAVDLVLLDMVMPGMDGAETFAALQADAPGLPVLLTSGFVQEDTTDRLLEQGARGLVSKPYKSNDLLAHIRRTLDEAPAPKDT